MRALLLAVTVLAACSAPAPQAQPSASASPAPSASPSPIPGALRFTVADASKATIRVRELLVGWPAPGDAVLTAEDVAGRFALGPDGGFAAGSEITVDLRTIRSDERNRDNAARETLDVRREPLARFTPLRTNGLPAPLPAAGEWTFTVTGTLTVKGTSKEVTWDATARRSGDSLVGTMRTAFAFTDFGMTPPRMGPVLSITDEIRLEIELSAMQERG